MTTCKSEISDIFSIFHDGSITKFHDNGDNCIINIDCMYLAERINQDHLYFILKVNGLRELSLNVWPRNKDREPWVMTDPKQIFQAELDIFNSELINDKIVVRVGQEGDKTLDYSGGDLTFDCDSIEIFTQDFNIISYETLVNVCKHYWDEFGRR